MADISIREYIRWIPDEASEPTTTVVLTSPEHRFVDVRLLLSGHENKTEEDGERV